MSTEAGLWKWLRDHLPPGHYTRLENSIGTGTPDVNYKVVGGSEGWMELKHYPDDCGPDAHPFKRKGLRPDQKNWIEERIDAGGTVWIVAGVSRSVYVVGGRYARAFNGWTRAELLKHSSYVLGRGLSGVEFAVTPACCVLLCSSR